MRVYCLSMLLLFFVGCAAVDRYDSCKSDPVCLQKMEDAKAASYVVSTSAAKASGVPSGAELIGLLVSNIVAFGTGVWHGKRKAG